MANSLLTINMITREAVRLFVNSNMFLQNIDRQHDSEFAKAGAKIGSTLRIRLPNDYTVRTGPAVSVQDTAEQSTTITVATQKGVDISFSSVERALSLDDYSERVLAPAINNLAGAVAADVMSGSEAIANYTALTDGSNNVISPTAATWLGAQAILDQNSAPMADRKIILDPLTEARTVSSLTGLFNPSPEISKQYRSGRMYDALGFKWMMDQTVLKHTAGTFSAGTVNGAGQTGSTLVTNAITGTLKKGDIITVALVHGVNRVTKVSTGQLRQFVVTADVATSATSIPIYPALTPASGGNAVQYQTVDVSPADSAAILLVQKASEVARKNFAYVPQAVTMVTADLELPRNMQEAHREVYDSVSMRIVSGYIIGTDQFVTRTDILYGYLWVRPEWAVSIMDVI